MGIVVSKSLIDLGVTYIDQDLEVRDVALFRGDQLLDNLPALE
jgi:hypothetical protein